jgi:Ner family transcriptional regulator
MQNDLQTDWHPEDVKAAIRKQGSTLAELASTAGVSKQSISAAIDRRASERIDQIIADFIGLKPHQIWPSRYNAKGKRIRYRAAPAAPQVHA